ncbi:MAG: hypothetical protein WAX77_05030 [Methylococcaceae bacterium]
MVQPLAKTHELEDKIELLINQKRKPDEFTIYLLKSDINKLEGKIKVYQYYKLLGAVAGFENDSNQVISNYQKALQYENDLFTHLNYMSALFSCGLIKESVFQTEILLNNFPNNANALNRAIKSFYFSCNFKKAFQLHKEFKTKNFFCNNGLAFNICEKFQLSDGQAQVLCELAYSLLETHNLYFSSSLIEIIDNCIVYTIYIDSPVKDIAKINWELSKLFVETLDDTWSDVLMFQYSSIDVLEAREKHERIV